AAAGDEVSAEGDDTGRRQVDAAVHDDEHLADRGEREHGRRRQDERPRRASESVGRDDRGYDDESAGSKPDGQKPGGEDRVGDEPSAGAARETSNGRRRSRAGRGHETL